MSTILQERLNSQEEVYIMKLTKTGQHYFA